MKLSDILHQLTHGEFAQLAIGGQPAGEINSRNYPQVAAHINLALTVLYTRFNLKRGKLAIVLQPGQVRYPLQSQYAQSNRNSRQPVKFIDDLSTPFMDDIIKIRSVLTDTGYELPLNDWAHPESVMTSSQRVLEIPELLVSGRRDIPEHLKTDRLTVFYQANHIKINEDTGLDFPEDMDIELPETHLEALLYFVAGRFQNPLGATDGFHAGNNYAAKYEQACQALENQGMAIDQAASTNRFKRNGWV